MAVVVEVETGGNVEVEAGGTGLAGTHPVPTRMIRLIPEMIFQIFERRQVIIILLLV
jgi:hypothetical protein